MKVTKRMISLFLALTLMLLGSVSAHASDTEKITFPEIEGKYMPAEIAEAIEHKNMRSMEYTAILNDVLLPASMGIEIPNINPESVYQTVDVYTLDPSFSTALADHGIIRTSMSYSEYEAIENTWLLPDDMIESIKRVYPELALIDMSDWTYGDYKNYSKEADYANALDGISAEQISSLEMRNIRIADLHYLIKEYHTIESVLAQSDSALKQTLEDAYQFTANMVGLTSSATRAAPPSNLYTYVYFPRYNGGNGDYFLNTVLTTTYWQGIQADRALQTQNTLYQSTSSTLYCTNMYGTYSYSQGGAHEGIDFVHPNGQSEPPIYAVFKGEKQDTLASHHLAVYDSDAPDEPKTYSYLHMSSITAGTDVSVESMVGYQGNQGNATGYHVHFEVHDGNTTTLSSGADHVIESLSPYRLQDNIGEYEG